MSEKQALLETQQTLDRIVELLTWAHFVQTKPTTADIIEARALADHQRRQNEKALK